ncbi:RidA family protein [Limobrevibacterium gyesilva]|uniref:RidA family protein n=1 Tax=Limobrevibacterium gyesilva TaxID=2991712 RepID=A0AA41YUA2_9PROT|nr:RidA family protein [Limobrevibacterium gyesilva]MCW3476693.1 RidA family protein [Limobrevibacterium gyesilva]
MSFEKRLAELGIVLPPPRAPLYAYVPVVVEGGRAWVSGQLPWDGDGLLATGKMGAGVDIALGQKCARACVLSGLSALRAELGTLDRVRRIAKVVGFVASAPDFYDQAVVMDGASTLFGEIFGEAGRHARSAIGMAALPRNVPVEVEFVAAVE